MNGLEGNLPTANVRRESLVPLGVAGLIFGTAVAIASILAGRETPQTALVGLAEDAGSAGFRAGDAGAPGERDGGIAETMPVSAEVEVSVRVRPRAAAKKAEIFVDGSLSGRRVKIAGVAPSAPKRIEVEVRAPGFKTWVKKIEVTRSMSLQVRLVADASESAKVRRHKRRKHRKRRKKRRAKPPEGPGGSLEL